MIFVTNENTYKELLNDKRHLLKVVYANNVFVEAWFSESDHSMPSEKIGAVDLQSTPNGIFGSIEADTKVNSETIEQITKEAYLEIFRALEAYPALNVIRFWNYVPAITASLADGSTIYQLFNTGRYKAFESFFSSKLDQMPIPAACAVGTKESFLKIEFLAVSKPVMMIENKDQIPAHKYSNAYGKIPPFFSRGVIYDNLGQRLLLSSGTASVVGEKSLHANDIYEQLSQTFHNLRILGSQFNLKKYDIHYGFALEDIRLLTVYYKHEHDRPFLERYIPKFLAPSCQIAFMHADICREELLVELEAVFVKKGESEQGILPNFYLGHDQRIKTESFEIHISEHCNLKCRDCCNISPFNPKKFMSLEEVKSFCDFIKMHFQPDVFKVAGGEPTLHTQINELLTIVKQSGVCNVIRVITNGLMLHKMTDEFWQNIDQLTISHYISAPMRPKILEWVKEKAKQYEIVLNIKYVDQFNEIFVDEAIEDKERIQNIYNDCWMRYRCLIIRNGRFHKCTRASYMDSYLALKGKSMLVGDSTYSFEDGISLSDPNFRANALLYLNSTTPLKSCEYCLGVSGGLRDNIQLKNLTL